MLKLNDTERRLLDVPLPMETNTYKPVAHRKFIEDLQSGITAEGIDISSKYFSVNGLGTQVIGRYTLSHRESDIALNIGFKNSYDKSMTAAIVIGATVIICSNGMIMGEDAFNRKHTGTVQQELDFAIKDYIEMAVERFQDYISVKETLKHTVFDKSTVNELVGRMYIEEDFLRAEQLSMIKKEYTSKTPTFDYKVDKDCAWNLYNICTYTIDKKTHPSLYLPQHTKLLSIFKEFSGIEEKELEIIDDL